MTEATIKKAESTRDAMKETIQIAIDRNTRLSDLNVVSNNMKENSEIFEKRSKEVKLVKRNEYCKTVIIYVSVLICVTLFGILFVWRLLFK